jgi:hypothetical protein
MKAGNRAAKRAEELSSPQLCKINLLPTLRK